MSVRWLNSDGVYVSYVNGQPIKDSVAKKMGLLPSVTSVMDVSEDPFLSSWKRQQVVLAAQKDPCASLEDVVGSAFESANRSASIGTQYHQAISILIPMIEKCKREAEYVVATVNSQVLGDLLDVPTSFYELLFDWYRSMGLRSKRIEHRSASKTLGFGGTVDFIGVCNQGNVGKEVDVVVDWKTQQTGGKSARYYPKWAVQLGAYQRLSGLDEDAQLMSVVIPTDKEDKIYKKIWTKDRSPSYWYGVFESMLNIWCSPLFMNYDPREL